MVRAAASWKRTATGKRMSLERWLTERRWLSTEEYANDNRPAHKWPSCVITKIIPRGEGVDFDGAKIWFRDRDGQQQVRVLDYNEYEALQEAVDRAACSSPSDDLHEFVGARFQLDDQGYFDVEGKAAA